MTDPLYVAHLLEAAEGYFPPPRLDAIALTAWIKTHREAYLLSELVRVIREMQTKI